MRKTLNVAFALLAVLVIPRALAFPVVVVGNAYDQAIKEPLEVKRWTQAFQYSQQQIQEATQIYQQARTVATFIGNPKASLQDLQNIAQISNTLGSIVGQDTPYGTAMKEVGQKGNDFSALFNSAQGLAGSISNTMNIAGQPVPRDVSLYQALAAAQQMADEARARIDAENKRDADQQKRIDKQIDDLLKTPNPTQTQIQEAMLRMQREQSLQLSAAARERAAQELAAQEAKAQAANNQAMLTSSNEASTAQGLADDATRAAQADASQQMVNQALTPTTPPPPDNSAIKLWLPPGTGKSTGSNNSGSSGSGASSSSSSSAASGGTS